MQPQASGAGKVRWVGILALSPGTMTSPMGLSFLIYRNECILGEYTHVPQEHVSLP